MKKALLLAALAGTIVATPAEAVTVICLGGGCAPQPDSIVLLEKDLTGTTVTGSLNNAPGTVSFSSTEDLISLANGQARVGAVDLTLNSPFTISFSDGLISALELAIDAKTAGKVSFSFVGGDSDGVTSGPFSLTEEGQDFFNAWQGTFSSVTLNFSDGATVNDIGQFRLNSAAAVPEPGTWALMIAGIGFVGAAMRRRKAILRYA